MSKEKTSPIESVEQSYLRLTLISQSLNAASDKLGQSITKVENLIKNLNLGISSWVNFQDSEDNGYYSYERLVYTKEGKNWGLFIKKGHGHEAEPVETSEIWAFNEAPRELRVRAIKKLPDLLARLAKDSEAIMAQVEKGTEDVDAFAETLVAASQKSPLPSSTNSLFAAKLAAVLGPSEVKDKGGK